MSLLLGNLLGGILLGPRNVRTEYTQKVYCICCVLCNGFQSNDRVDKHTRELLHGKLLKALQGKQNPGLYIAKI